MKMKQEIAFLFVALFAIPVLADKPNVIVILADDLGYGDVQPLNPDSKILTPNFNRLAKAGMTFTDSHSPSAVCTPTRYGLLCGRYPWRSTLKRGVLGGYSKPLIEAERPTVASMMKSAGYRTACVGKWHLGLGWQLNDEPKKDTNNLGIAGEKAGNVDYSKPLTHGPTTLGFDQSLIVPASLDMSPYVYVRDDRVTSIPETIIPGKRFPTFYRKGEIAADFDIEKVLDKLTTEACQFISGSAKQQQPFFLYFPLTAPHKPVMPAERFKEKTQFGPYGDFITQVDWTIGQVLKTLDESGATENTLLIVTSDNGSFMHRYDQDKKDHREDASVQGFNASNHRANGPWRGTKADIWEAGHRVRFFVQWPEKIKGNSRCDKPICHTDILATVAEITGQEFDEQSAEDSHSFLASLVGEGKNQRPPIIHHSISGMLAIRSGQWKLVLGNGSGGRQKPRGKAFEQPFILVDLNSDPAESTNAQPSHSKIAESLHEKFESISHGDHDSSQ